MKKLKRKKKAFRVPPRERGKSKILIVIIAVVLLVGIGAFYFLNQKSSMGLSIPGVHAPLNPNCKYNDPDLCKFVNNWKDIKDYSVSSSTTTNGTKMESLMELNAAGNTHLKTSENGKDGYETITIGDTTYSKDYSDGKWWKQVTKATPTNDTTTQEKDSLDFGKKADEVVDKTTYKSMGKEACGSRTCFKYEVVNPDDTSSTEYIYFDDSEYILRKTVSKTSDGSVSESSFSYDHVSIAAPSPTKDATDGQNIYNNSAPSTQDINKMIKQNQDGNQVVPPVDAPTNDNSSSDY